MTVDPKIRSDRTRRESQLPEEMQLFPALFLLDQWIEKGKNPGLEPFKIRAYEIEIPSPLQASSVIKNGMMIASREAKRS